MTELLIRKKVENVSKIRFNHGDPFLGSITTQKLIKVGQQTYLAYDALSRLHKIGRSCNVGLRIRELNNEFKTNLQIVLIIDRDVERMLHRKYSTHKVFGEWFFLSDRILNEIKSLA